MKLQIHLIVKHPDTNTRFQFEETLNIEDPKDQYKVLLDWIDKKRQIVSNQIGVDFWSLAWEMTGTPVL